MTHFLPFSGHWSTDDPTSKPAVPERKSTAARMTDPVTFPSGRPVSAHRVFDDAGTTTAVDPATLRPTTDRFTADTTESVEAWLINLVGSVATDESRWSRVQRRYARTLRNTVGLILSGDYVVGSSHGSNAVLIGDVETAVAYLHRTAGLWTTEPRAVQNETLWIDLVTDRVATMRTRRTDKARRRRQIAAAKLKAAPQPITPAKLHSPSPAKLNTVAAHPRTTCTTCTTVGVADCPTHRPV